MGHISDFKEAMKPLVMGRIMIRLMTLLEKRGIDAKDQEAVKDLLDILVEGMTLGVEIMGDLEKEMRDGK